MMPQIIFVHGMFQTPKSWNSWITFFTARGYECVAPAWPLHEGEPSDLRVNPPAGLGDLALDEVIAHIEAETAKLDDPIMIGHSVGGLITQILLDRGRLAGGIAISSVAPNAMLDFDWGFLKNSALISNPLKGNEPFYMDAKSFHGSFANTLSESAAAEAFERTATHDSRNVLRDCMGSSGRVNLDGSHAPLLLIGGEKDQIVPAHLNQKNRDAYTDEASVTDFQELAGRSHFICGEPGWEEVATYAANWLEHNFSHRARPDMQDASPNLGL